LVVRSNFRTGFYAGLALAFVVGIYLVRLWQPERQVGLHSEHLIAHIENRQWSRVGDFVSSAYHDAWGNDRAQLLARLRMALHFFPKLDIVGQEPQTQIEIPEGDWRAKIQIHASGNEAAPEIEARVNNLAEPFDLRWRRESRWPWDWKLVSVTNPALELPAEDY
jgi:hypothetical protein